MFTWRFWRETIERGVKSSAQAVILGLGLGEGLNAFDVDWRLALGFGAGGLILSVLTSLVSVQVGANDSPSAIG